MDATTQRNVALVEEAAATARTLQEQAGRLAGRMARFRTASRPRTRRGATQAVTRPGRRCAPPGLAPAQSSDYLARYSAQSLWPSGSRT